MTVRENQKQMGGETKASRNVTTVVATGTLREAVRQNDKNTPNGVENINSVKTSKTIKRVNIQNDLVVKDAIVEAMVGMGGQMLKFLVLLDSGADFSCARNNALLRLKEFGVNFVLKDPSGKGHGCVAANGTPMKVNGEINLDVDVNLESKRLVLENLKFVVMDNLSADFIIGVNVLRQTGFGIQGNSIWLGDATGRVSAIKKNYDILEKSGVWTGGDETWCLYEVHEPMKVMPTGVADSKLHIKPTSESTNISHITRESSSEMRWYVFSADNRFLTKSAELGITIVRQPRIIVMVQFLVSNELNLSLTSQSERWWTHRPLRNKTKRNSGKF